MFIDFQNFFYSLTNLYEMPYEDAGDVAVGLVASQLEKLKSQYGEIIIRQAFGDWSAMQDPKKELQRLGIRIIDILSTEYKNSADIELSLAAQETILTRDDVDTIVIFAGDRDYMPIANRARESGKKLKSPESRRKESESVYSLLKNYSVDYAAEMKATFLAIYYLETRGKKRSSESIGKFVSMPEEDLDMVLEHSKIEGWLKGGTSNMAITPNGLKFIEERNFPNRLKQHVYDEHIFSAWKATGELRHIFLDNLRMLFLEAIYHMQYPEKLEDLSAEVKSGDNYFKLSRSLRIALMQDDMFRSNSGSLVFMKQNMENEMSMWILELISFLSIYGLVRMSSPVAASDVYIFPEQEFIEIYDKKGDIRYEDDKRSEQKPVKVLPNNDILVGIGADFTDLKKVADFSELVSADLVCTFRITKASLSAYLNKSGKITEVISFLKKKSSVQVPDTVLRLISDMEKKVDEVRVTKCQAVLQVDDRTVIDGIMNITGISDMIEKRISPEILAIKEGVSLYKFVTELRKKGYIVPIKVEKEKNSRRPVWYSW